MAPERLAGLKNLAAALALTWRDLTLLDQALTHTSYAHENKHAARDNERLEFLGDTVLELVVSDYLFRRYPAAPEGELTKLRAALVCEQTLARRAEAVHLGLFLQLGKGEEASGGRARPSILADAFEALVGAVYLDQGLAAATRFIISQLRDEKALLADGAFSHDYKTMLQELVQKQPDSHVTYQVIGEQGPDHDKVFQVAAYINARCAGTGTGKSKKEAEQHAARQAWEELSGGGGEQD